jgi:hypothetical protein
MDMTLDVQLIEKCVSANVVADCNDKCQWRKGTNAGTDPVKPVKVPLFTEDFCHPVVVNKDTKTSVFDECFKESATTCSLAAGCNWSSGQELIPDHDFCAPMDLTKDTTLIKKCLGADVVADCNDGCQWRKGTSTGTDTTIIGKPLFKTDFCHPVTVTE